MSPYILGGGERFMCNIAKDALHQLPLTRDIVNHQLYFIEFHINLSPLYPSFTIDLHVRIAADFHQSFIWLRPTRA